MKLSSPSPEALAHLTCNLPYSIFGYLTNAVDTAGRVTRQSRHATGQLASHARQADNGQWATVTFDYDQQMDALRIRDPLDREVERYALDAVGRATNVWDIENRRMAIRYALGDLVSGIDRFDGSTVSFDYDGGARLTRARYQPPITDHGSPVTEISFTHLACGRPATASNAASRIAWSYDGAGRLTNETAVTTLGASSLSQQLDPSGLPTNTHLSVESCALNVERSFDAAARLSTQTTEAGAFAWSYTPWNGLPAAITNLDSGLSVAYEYDVLDRVTNIHWRKANGATLRNFGYAFDRAGNITNVLMEGEALPSRRTLYGYDMLGRLTAETTPGRANAWSYDLADNRTNAVLNGTSTAYTLGIGDRLASTSASATYLYNAAGCVTNISVPSVSSVVSLHWNSQYQLTAAYTNGVLAESYQYDALNRRISTTSGGTTTYHVYDDNWQVLADLDASGRPLRSYTWGPGIDNLLAVTVYGEAAINTYYALTDHLGTVHALADASGAIAESYEFDAWGNVLTVRDASGTPIGNRQSAIGNRHLFQGREYSYSTGLYHFRMRWYDPVTGRWLSPDPIGISGGLNQYVAFGNNPVNATDPNGEWITIAVGAVVGGVWGAATGGWSGGWKGAVSGAIGGAISGAIMGSGGSPVMAGAVGGAASSIANQLLNRQNPFSTANLAKTAINTGVGAIFGKIAEPLGESTAAEIAVGLGSGAASTAGETVVDAVKGGVDLITKIGNDEQNALNPYAK